MEGIAVGKVTANWDEDHPGKVQVEYLLGAAGEMKTDWIPVMTPYGGNAYGTYHLPSAGNSVVIGFEQGNANRPVVLGCIWNQDNPIPGETANENNSKLLWKSRSGYTFFVEEEEKKISFSDPEGKNTLTWSTEEKSLTVDVEEKIVLKIGTEDFLTLEKGKITVSGELEIGTEGVTAKAGSISVKTNQGYEVEAGQDVSVKGTNIALSPSQNTTIEGIKAEIKPKQGVEVKAQQIALEGTTAAFKGKQTTVEGTVLELKAQASGKLESGGILEVKGSILKLN